MEGKKNLLKEKERKNLLKKKEEKNTEPLKK